MLAQFAKQIFCMNNEVQFPYSLRGTSTALRQANANLLFLCDHQMRDYSADQIAIQVCRSDKLITASNLIIPKNEQDEAQEFSDIRALLYKNHDYSIENIATNFFEFRDSDCWPRNSLGTLVAFGFPFSQINYDVVENNRVDATQIDFVGEHESIGDAAYTEVMKLRKPFMSDLDGISGGPVFHIGRDQQGFFAGFAGIITRASLDRARLQFINARFVQQVFKKIEID